MSKIVITARGAPTAAVIAGLRKATTASLADLRDVLHGDRVLLERVVFGNDHDEAALEILGVIDCLEDHHIHYRVFELEPGESLSEELMAVSDVGLATLKNILER